MFSNEQLQTIIDGKSVGDQFPYNTNNEQEIEAHIRRLFHRVERIPNLIVEAEWDNFGSGYASFVEFFCYQKENVVVVDEKNGERELEVDGIIIDICRLAPVVIIGEDKRFKTIDIATNEEIAGVHGSLLDGLQRLNLSRKFQGLDRLLKQALEEFGYEKLDEDIMKQPLPFKAKISTTYTESQAYKVMDALFYWED